MKGALKSYLTDIRDIQKFVSNDRTVQGIESFKPVAQTVVKDGESLKDAIKPVLTTIDQVKADMTQSGTNEGTGSGGDQKLQTRRSEMKNLILLAVVMAFALTTLSGCVATMHTWPDDERSAENKMVVIQEKIGSGLKSGALTPDQSQMYLTTLKGIRTDYEGLRDKVITRDKWNSLNVRLDALDEEINKTLARTPKIEEPRNGDRIVTLQRRIDNGKISERLPLSEGSGFQARLDSIRRDYLRMTEEGSYASNEERADISRKLDSLETDLNRFR